MISVSIDIALAAVIKFVKLSFTLLPLEICNIPVRPMNSIWETQQLFSTRELRFTPTLISPCIYVVLKVAVLPNTVMSELVPTEPPIRAEAYEFK